MTTILACIDASIYNESVLDHAAWASDRLGGAAVHVLHVLSRQPNEASADHSGALGVDAADALLRELAALDEQRGRLALQRGRAMLDAAEARLRAAGVAHSSTAQRHGSLVDTIIEHEAGADLVVIGKRGARADFATGHLGANLERVLRASPRPVLVASRAFRSIRRFAIAYDGGPTALKVVEFVAKHPALDGLECHLITVAPAGGAGETLLATPAAVLARAGKPATVTVLRGEVDAAIAAHVSAAEMDLLVMGAYGHGRLRAMMLGSTTTALLRACRIPVLVAR
ncbi:universal stress protein [Sabulicella glaciei]|uniref:Universal stress protein n=1 Tax=Sabulicella glaciei TaxID=2984948 RepID=A0ABT3NVS4_9PROT|nr:universal stress protein [Roseococcus sp. MDT2-1-1]MCW8086263.1 universal stress protein [Roseococcus sp. MDT2-1-1]